MNLVQHILTDNQCFKAGKKIKPTGIMLHSVGVPQPNAAVFLNTWNTEACNVCVHAFVDGNDGTVYQTLPWDHRAWHCGSSANNTHISVEMCEPAYIRYISGSSFSILPGKLSECQESAKRTYTSAVELFAMLCKEYGLDPLKSKTIISHAEGHKLGMASNHGDPEHLWKQLKLGFTMDGFRKDVAAKMADSASSGRPSGSPEEPFLVKTKTALNIRTSPSLSAGIIGVASIGVYTIVKTYEDWGLLKSYQKNQNGWISIKEKYAERV